VCLPERGMSYGFGSIRRRDELVTIWSVLNIPDIIVLNKLEVIYLISLVSKFL